jgi:hypothetical protein
MGIYFSRQRSDVNDESLRELAYQLAFKRKLASKQTTGDFFEEWDETTP